MQKGGPFRAGGEKCEIGSEGFYPESPRRCLPVNHLGVRVADKGGGGRKEGRADLGHNRSRWRPNV